MAAQIKLADSGTINSPNPQPTGIAGKLKRNNLSIKQTEVETADLFNGSVRVEFRPQGHKYSVIEDGVRTHPPSVTTITGTLSKPAILPWGINCTIDACRECIKPYTLYTPDELEKIWAAARQQSLSVKEEAAGIGTAAHDWIHEHLSGRKPEMPAEGTPQRRCVDAVLDFFLTHDVQLIHTECPIYSRVYKFSGRMDLDAWVDGKRTLVDFKTGNGIYEECRLQTAAYSQARYEELGVLYDQRLILRLGKQNGEFYEKFYPAADQVPDLLAFLGLKIAYDRLTELERGCELCGQVTERRTRCKECKKLACKKCVVGKICGACDPLGEV